MRRKIVFAALFLSLVCGGVALYGQSGSEKCPDCKGTGVGDVCWACNGTKVMSIFNGFFTMTFPCTGCNGTGRIYCFTCNGTGRVAVRQTDQEFRPSGGDIGNRGGGGGSVESSRIPCKSCQGSGRCTSCGGNYSSSCRYCNGIGKTTYGYGSNAEYKDCAPCKGSGKNYCAVCYDACHVPGKCCVCKGSGYIY